MSERGPQGTWEWFCYWHPQGSIDLDRTLADLPADDFAASRLILEEFGGRLHYLVQSGTWLLWDGRCHRPDDGAAVQRLASAWGARYKLAADAAVAADRAEFLRTSDAQTEAAANAAADRWVSRWEGKAKYCASLRRSAGKNSLLSYLADEAGCPDVSFNEAHPEWLNCANGTVDLRTGLIKAHAVGDRLTYCLDTAYVPGAECPGFGRLIRSACGGSDEVPRYLMKLLGYSLLGHNQQQKIVFISGPSASGKSKLLEVAGRILGPAAHDSQAALITLVRHGRNARTENSIRGKRLISITETSEFMTIDEGQLKRLTGESRIAVDQHYAKTEIETPVTWLIIVATNNMPTLSNFDGAMRRRIIVIPGGETIPEWAQDPGLADRIVAEEAEGVLAALVRACVRYHAESIRALPEEVRAATDLYAVQQNTVEQFLADLCEDSGPEDRISQNELWQVYQRWARGSAHLGRNSFFDHLERAGYTRDTVRRWFGGIRWKGSGVTQDFLNWHAGQD